MVETTDFCNFVALLSTDACDQVSMKSDQRFSRCIKYLKFTDDDRRNTMAMGHLEHSSGDLKWTFNRKPLRRIHAKSQHKVPFSALQIIY